MNQLDKLFKQIIENNFESTVLERVDELKSEYVSDWKDEFENIHEAYNEQGRGEAESQVVQELIIDADIMLPSDDYCNLMEKLAEHYNLNLN